MLPLSVVIATYNRKDELRRTLLQMRAQSPTAEVIVVDNASPDGTAVMLRQYFPEVRLIENASNEGVPAFGTGVLASSQPFVFLLDDDAAPEPSAFERALSCLEQNPQVAVIACHIVDDSGEPVTDRWPAYPICFWGCGAVLRRSALAGQPYMYDPRLFLHGTEMDLAVRLYADGYFIRYLPDVVVRHRFSPQNRSTARRLYYLTQSAVWFGAKHLPLRYALPAVARHLGLLFLHAARERRLDSFLSGLAEAVRQLRLVLKERCPVPREVARVYYAQVWEYEPLLSRALRRVKGRHDGRRARRDGFPPPASEVVM